VTPVRVGIVGAGYIARAHAMAYLATPAVDLVAIADTVPAKAGALAETVGAEPVDGLAALLARGIQAVSICTPSPTHADLAVEALEAGLHVLCEKPIARSLADAERIVAASAGAPGVLMVGHVSRFEPDHARAREVVATGGIGEIRMLSQSIVSSAPTWSEQGWLLDHRASGGPLIDLAIHSFDYLAWVCGHQPVRVQAIAAATAAGPDTYALATLRYANGAIGTVETSWGHPPAYGFHVATELNGSGGRLWWDYDGISAGRMATTGGAITRFDVLGQRGFQAEIEAFVAAARTGGRSPVPATEGMLALRTALAAERSIQTGQPVSLAEIE